MKFNFKKVAAVTASMLATVGLTAGVASAVQYPDNWSSSNVAVVYGNDLDSAVATNINEDIDDSISFESGGSSASVGEESFMISATGDDLTFQEAFSDVTDSLDDGDLPSLLAEGELEDESVDYDEEESVDYFQDIELSGDFVTYSSLDDDEYTINTDLADDEEAVLNVDQSTDKAYDLVVDFSTEINASAYDDSEAITVFGKELTFDPEMSDDDTELVLYESSETITLAAGESKTVDGDTIEVIGANTDDDTATISINGNNYQVESGDKEDNFYVNDVFMQTVPEKSASVELFVGAKEWSIDGMDGSETDVEIDSDEVDGVQAIVTASNDDVDTIEDITFRVTPSDMDEDEKSYLEIGEALEDPLFDLSMVFDSVNPELKSDDKGTIGLSASDTVSLDFTSRNGKEYDISPFEISSGDDAVTAGEDWYADGNSYTGLEEDDIFVAYEGNSDETNPESEETLVYSVDTINDGDDTPSVVFEELSSGSTTKVYEGNELKSTDLYVPTDIEDGDSSFDLQDSSDSTGSAASVNNQIVTENHMRMTLSNEVTIDVSDVSATGSNVTINDVTYESVASADDGGSDQDDYEDDATLAAELTNDGFSATDNTDGTVTIANYEVDTYSTTGDASASNDAGILLAEDEDEVFNLDSSDLRSDIDVNVTVDTSDEELEVRPTGGDEFEAVSNSDTDTTSAVSKVGTYYESDNDEYASMDIWTPTEGQTVYEVYFSGEASEDGSSDGEAGTKAISADEGYSDNDVVIAVGGSCINSAAAEALGVSEETCGSDFTDATGVGSGEFLIQKVSDAYDSGATAIVVAGYEASDTEAAGNTFIDEDVELSEDGQVYETATKEVVTAE